MKSTVNRYHYLFVLIAFILLSSSCRIDKEYSQPKIEIAEKFRIADDSNPVMSANTGSIAEMEWREFFTDVTLRGIIDSVLHRNYDMQIALNTIRVNQEFLKQAKLAWLPTVEAGVAVNSSHPSQNSLNGLNLSGLTDADHIEDYTATLGVSWEIDIWGKISRRKETALALYLQSEEAVKSVQTQLISASASAYYNILMLREQLDIAHRNVVLLDSTQQMIQLQLEAGQVSVLAIQQAKVQKKTTEALIPKLEQALQIQENALNILMANQPQKISTIAKLNSFTVPDKFSIGVPAALLSRRPDVRESEYALQEANARIGIAQANRYPTLSITASSGLNAFKASDWFTMPASIFGNVAANLMQPIMNKRELKTQLEVAKIKRENAVINFRAKVLNAVGEVSDAFVQLDKLKEQVDITQSQKDILQEAIPNAQLLFNSGMATYLEVIAAQQNALQNELTLADLKRQQINAYVFLFRSLGGGVE